MSARSEHRGRLAGVDLYAGTIAQVALRHGVTATAVKAARRRAKRGPTGVVLRSDGARWNGLVGADLTRPTAELVAEYEVSKSAVSKARRAAGIVAPPKPGRPKGVGCVVAPRASVAPKPAPTFEERDLVAAVDEELSICPAPFVAALVVSKRLRLPMERVLAVAEQRCGMAAK